MCSIHCLKHSRTAGSSVQAAGRVDKHAAHLRRCVEPAGAAAGCCSASAPALAARAMPPTKKSCGAVPSFWLAQLRRKLRIPMLEDKEFASSYIRLLMLTHVAAEGLAAEPQHATPC